LSQLFWDRDELILIHNMGAACPMCALWADGFNGYVAHLADRAAFVVSTPDSPAQQRTFAAKRGWRFPMVSWSGTDFAQALGFAARTEKGLDPMPGISVFQRRADGRILRVAKATICPSDEFNAAWNLMDLLPGGRGEWFPKFAYPEFVENVYA
jgi:predicted dithiol-disulfide oxidoreductase (DUF899 family)